MSILLHDGLFVGNASDIYKFAGSILHCARDPWFTDLTKIGWVEPSFTWFRQAYNEMALNMVDAENPRYFSDEMINAGLDFITERLAEGDPVLVHCNAGLSRSPSMAFLWMFEHGFLDDEFRYAVPQFKNIYPDYMPGNGIWEYLKNRCDTSKKFECQGIGRGASCGATATEVVKSFGHIGGDNWGDKDIHLCSDCKKELDRQKKNLTKT